MIDTQQTPSTVCLACGRPIEQKRGHRKRLYCDDTCRQRGHRHREQETSEARITALKNEVQRLQQRLNVEERFRTDTQVRHFKSWVRSHPQQRDNDFAKRFLDDTRLPQHASRALYTAHLKQYGYSAEDVYLFEEMWKDMLFKQP
jgi:hypothetical protein